VRILVIGARGIPGVEGGAEKNAENLFPALAAENDVCMLCLAEFCSTDNYRGVQICRVPTWRLFRTDKILYYLYSLYLALRWRPDIVHCQGLNAAFFLWFYQWVAQRVVVRYGSADYLNAKWTLIGRLGFRWCEFQLRWADAVIAVTPSLRNRLLQRSAEHRVVVIPNAVDAVATTPAASALERFDLAPNGYVLTVGRVTWQKDFETLIRAFVVARAAEPNLGKLAIVGGDDSSGYLQHLRAIADEHVVFTGRLRREELGDLYAHCRLYVNSSRHEGLSNAILEAVSHGCPIVASDIVENRDLPLAPRHFFAAGDATALSQKLREVGRGDVDLTIDPGVFATWPRVVAATRQLYDTLLATPRRDRAPLPDAVSNAFGSPN